jgi:hypothetical protein
VAVLQEGGHSVYYASFSAILVLQEPSTAKQLQKSAEEQFARGHLLGEVRRTEGWNPATFRNALELLTRRGILKTVEGERERERSYARGEAFEDLAGLRERLAAAVLAG